MAYTRKRIYIVDGYNVIRSGSRYKTIMGPDYTHEAFNKARDTLINDVVNYAGREARAIIVFDAQDNAESLGRMESVGHIKIMFSPAGTSADKVIEKLAHDYREKGIETIVVTSDASIQDTVFGGGVDRMSAEGFSQEMNDYDDEVHVEDTFQTTSKRTIAGRISPETLAKLIKMRDEAGRSS